MARRADMAAIANLSRRASFSLLLTISDPQRVCRRYGLGDLRIVGQIQLAVRGRFPVFSGSTYDTFKILIFLRHRLAHGLARGLRKADGPVIRLHQLQRGFTIRRRHRAESIDPRLVGFFVSASSWASWHTHLTTKLVFHFRSAPGTSSPALMAFLIGVRGISSTGRMP